MHPGLLSLAIPHCPWVGTMSTGSGQATAIGRNGEFCVLPCTRTAGILAYSRLKALIAGAGHPYVSYAGLIRLTLAGLKAYESLERGWAPVTDMVPRALSWWGGGVDQVWGEGPSHCVRALKQTVRHSESTIDLLSNCRSSNGSGFESASASVRVRTPLQLDSRSIVDSLCRTVCFSTQFVYSV